MNTNLLIVGHCLGCLDEVKPEEFNHILWYEREDNDWSPSLEDMEHYGDEVSLEESEHLLLMSNVKPTQAGGER